MGFVARKLHLWILKASQNHWCVAEHASFISGATFFILPHLPSDKTSSSTLSNARQAQPAGCPGILMPWWAFLQQDWTRRYTELQIRVRLTVRTWRWDFPWLAESQTTSVGSQSKPDNSLGHSARSPVQGRPQLRSCKRKVFLVTLGLAVAWTASTNPGPPPDGRWTRRWAVRRSDFSGLPVGIRDDHVAV